MNSTFIIRFSSINNAEILADALSGLSHHKAGARFQKKMSFFGEEVNKKLEGMMDKWPMEYFYAEEYERVGDQFLIGFLTASDGEGFAKDIRQLLEMCGVSDLRVDYGFDDE